MSDTSDRGAPVLSPFDGQSSQSGGPIPGMILCVGVIVFAAGIVLLVTRSVPAQAGVPLILVGVLLTVISIIVLSHRWQKKRLEQLAATLDGFGLTLTKYERKSGHVPDAWTAFAKLKDLKTGVDGLRWSAEGTLDGRRACGVVHSYTVSTGKNTTTYYHACYAVECPTGWPGLSLTSEHLGHKLLGLFGKKDLQLEDKRFNDRWRIATDDEDFAILLLSPEVQEFLREPDKTAGRSAAWHIGEGWIRLVVDGNPSPEAAGAAVERLRVLRMSIASELDAYVR
ncbi:MAG: hypothetical protein AAGG07_14545 [Planctomycetota bacterium]